MSSSSSSSSNGDSSSVMYETSTSSEGSSSQSRSSSELHVSDQRGPDEEVNKLEVSEETVATESERSSVGEAASVKVDETSGREVGPSGRTFPYLEYVDGHASLGEDFLKTHGVSSRVAIRLLNSAADVTFQPGHITVPLMAITEGGLTFPIRGLAAQMLHRYQLTPYQVSVNTFRLLGCFEAVIRRDGGSITLGDVMELYNMSYNKSSKRYYLSARRGTGDLFTRMPDSEKWAGYYVEVTGAFSSTSPSNPKIPTELGDPGKLDVNSEFLTTV